MGAETFQEMKLMAVSEVRRKPTQPSPVRRLMKLLWQILVQFDDLYRDRCREGYPIPSAEHIPEGLPGSHWWFRLRRPGSVHVC